MELTLSPPDSVQNVIGVELIETETALGECVAEHRRQIEAESVHTEGERSRGAIAQNFGKARSLSIRSIGRAYEITDCHRTM
jgi:hypothetical protein